MVRDADSLGDQHRGEVVAVSSHHVVLKVSDLVAIRYERQNLERRAHIGERVTIEYDQTRSRVYEQGKEPARERSRDMLMERERSLDKT